MMMMMMCNSNCGWWWKVWWNYVCMKSYKMFDTGAVLRCQQATICTKSHLKRSAHLSVINMAKPIFRLLRGTSSWFTFASPHYDLDRNSACKKQLYLAENSQYSSCVCACGQRGAARVCRQGLLYAGYRLPPGLYSCCSAAWRCPVPLAPPSPWGCFSWSQTGSSSHYKSADGEHRQAKGHGTVAISLIKKTADEPLAYSQGRTEDGKHLL